MKATRLQTEIKWGSETVPIIRRFWKSAPRQPYRKTYSMKAGNSWFDMDTTENQWESYVSGEHPMGPIPVGALVAKELIEGDAVFAAFTEIWHGFVIVDSNLLCVEGPPQVQALLEQIRAKSDGKLSGFPDAFSFDRDGRFSFREIKNVANKDKLNANQHRMADILRELLGSKADFAVVEWDF